MSVTVTCTLAEVSAGRGPPRAAASGATCRTPAPARTPGQPSTGPRTPGPVRPVTRVGLAGEEEEV